MRGLEEPTPNVFFRSYLTNGECERRIARAMLGLCCRSAGKRMRDVLHRRVGAVVDLDRQESAPILLVDAHDPAHEA